MADGGSLSVTERFTPERATERALRDALGRFATGVTVVTTAGSRGPVGITANSFASVSLDPPLVLWSPARASRRFPAFSEATYYAIHVLGEDQIPLCKRFASDGLNFEGLDFATSSEGIPLIAGCLARFSCRRVAAHDGGDHVIIVGQVIEAEYREGAPLLFSSGCYGRFTGAG